MTATLVRPHLDDGILTDAEYIHLLDRLLHLRRLSPNIRLGQLLCNMTMHTQWAGDPGGVWDMEDSELLSAVETHIENYEAMGREPVIITAADLEP
jgi:hypothetical protein